jgi:hypothetical protein
MDHKLYIELQNYIAVLKSHFPKRIWSHAKFTYPYVMNSIDNALKEYERISSDGDKNGKK